ncbi:hypothetical protein D9M68_926830 [compost metagenome]
MGSVGRPIHDSAVQVVFAEALERQCAHAQQKQVEAHLLGDVFGRCLACDQADFGGLFLEITAVRVVLRIHHLERTRRRVCGRGCAACENSNGGQCENGFFEMGCFHGKNGTVVAWPRWVSVAVAKSLNGDRVGDAGFET